MTYFHIAKLTVPAVWIAVLVALIASPILHRVLYNKNISDWYWSAFFLYFIVWKLSYILFNFHLFLQTPLSILYFNGGIKGHIIALASLSVYLLFFAARKYPFVVKEAPLMFLFYFFFYEITVSSLEKNATESILHVVLLVIFLLLFKKSGKLSIKQLFILSILLEILIISTFRSAYSIESLTFIWIGSIFLFLTKKKIQEGLHT